MRVCNTCGERYRDDGERCPFDGGVLEPLPDVLLGTQLGRRFTLLEPIGRGSLSLVYRAHDQSNGRTVAVKVLDPELARIASYRERFTREARAMSDLRHPGIVEILAVGDPQEERATFFAMSLYAGRTLRQELTRAGALAQQVTARIGDRLASALAQAHAHGIVHRDLKPDNVIARADSPEDAVLLDFGLASVAGEVGLTATGQLIGTPAYMAPEQIRGEPPTEAMDFYALGCTLYELLSGRPPFVGTASAVLDAHLHEQPAPLPGAGLVMALLAKDQAVRTEAFRVLAGRSDQNTESSLSEP